MTHPPYAEDTIRHHRPIFAAGSRARALCLVGVACSLLFAASCEDGTAPAARSLTIVSGSGGRDSIGVRLPAPMVVQLRGPHGLPIPRVELVFRGVRAVGDTTAWPPVYIARTDQPYYAVRELRDTTDADGRVSVFVVLGAPAGEGKVVVSAPSLGLSTSASFTTLAGAPTAVALSPRDTAVYVGASYRLAAHLVDRLGDSIPATTTFTTVSNDVAVSASGTVEGKAIGRARITVRTGALVDSAFASVVPEGTIAIFDYGHFVGDTAGIAEVGLDGGSHRWIAVTGQTPTEFSPSNAVGPQWIPGSSQVVYSQPVDGAPRLFVASASQPPRRLITGPAETAGESEPDVSPDGRWIYFRGPASDGTAALWRVATAGGTPERLTASAPGIAYDSPTLSPDGASLAYASGSEYGTAIQLYVRDLPTGTAARIGTQQAAGARWSPVGDWILYAVSGAYAGYSGQLRVIHPDGTGDRALIDGAYYPGGTWSPDGKYVLAVRAEVGHYGWELIDVDAGTRIPLAFNGLWYGPAWRR